MYSKYFRLLCVFAILLMAMMACTIGAPPAGTMPTPVSTTEIGQDVPTATETELPTETATLEPTLEPTETPALEPSVTPTVALPVASVVKEINCRVGPGGAYDLVVIFKIGDTVEVMARDLGGGFVFVKNSKNPDQACWVLENGLKISGNVTPLPAFTPPPSPTLAPSFTVKYKNTDTCKGTFTRFTVTNTGSSGFRSAYVKVTNLKNNESNEQSVNAFDLTTGCIIAKNIAPLGIGQEGFLQSIFFRQNPKGQKMRGVFQLCTEQFLKGACVTQVLEFIAK